MLTIWIKFTFFLEIIVLMFNYGKNLVRYTYYTKEIYRKGRFRTLTLESSNLANLIMSQGRKGNA